MDKAQRDGLVWQRIAQRAVGAGLLVASGAIHLDLYLTGYRSIPTIGALFLFQVIVTLGLGAAVLVSGSRLVAAAGAGMAIATLGGYLLSLRIDLFGFREVRTAAGIWAGVIEVAAFASLAALVLSSRGRSEPAKRRAARDSDRVDTAQAGPQWLRWAAATISALAGVLLATSLAVTGAPPASTRSSRTLVKIAQIGGVSVVTDANGFALYWFAPDSPSKSACYGSCATYWPPLTGNPAAGPGVTGELGTIRRSDSVMQVSYDHHPLYTYIGDAAPRQASGNNLNLNGGLWHEMLASG